MNEVFNFISQVGFPIVMCIMFFLYIKETEKNRKEESTANTQALTNMANALQNNTDVVSNLTAIISQYLPVIIQTRNDKMDNDWEGH